MDFRPLLQIYLHIFRHIVTMNAFLTCLFTLATLCGQVHSLSVFSSVKSKRNCNFKMSGEINSKPHSPTNFKTSLLKATESTTKVALSLLASASVMNFPSNAFAKDSTVWEKVSLPVSETLFDISFDPSKPLHGWVVGSKGTFLETFDGLLYLYLISFYK